MDKVQRDGDIGDAQRTPDHQHDHHWHDRAAQPAQNARRAMAERQQAVEQCGRVGLLHAEGNDLRLTAERADEPRRPKVNAQADDLGHQHRAEGTEFHALFYAVRLACTNILADEGRQRHREAGHRQEGEALHLAVRATARHGLRTERVDVGLHNDVGNRNDRVLHAGGQALHNDRLERRAVKSDFPPADGPFFLGAHQLGEGENGADRLGGNGGEGCRAHAEAQPADQN